MNFLMEAWQRKRERTIDWIGDIYEIVLTISGLFLVYAVLEIGKLLNYSKDRLDLLERIDFGFVVAAVVVLGLSVLGRLAVNGLGLEKRPHKTVMRAPRKTK